MWWREIVKERKIDLRFKPPVSGIDLWQAMNYIALDDVSLDFIYNCYTSSTICYESGSRPALEKIAKRFCGGNSSPMKKIESLAKYVADEIRWAGYYEREQGRRLPPDRNMSEEQILASGYGWCNEQARLFCVLAQIGGIPARMVFGGCPEGGYGHVVAEALTPGGWMMVDQSFGYCFIREGHPVRAWDVVHLPEAADHFRPVYYSLCQQMEQALGKDILSRDFKMAVVENPLLGFSSLGFCNHFAGGCV